MASQSLAAPLTTSTKATSSLSRSQLQSDPNKTVCNHKWITCTWWLARIKCSQRKTSSRLRSWQVVIRQVFNNSKLQIGYKLKSSKSQALVLVLATPEIQWGQINNRISRLTSRNCRLANQQRCRVYDVNRNDPLQVITASTAKALKAQWREVRAWVGCNRLDFRRSQIHQANRHHQASISSTEANNDSRLYILYSK